MTLEDELEALERERAVVIRASQYEYARLKRDVRRAVSPDRFVRKHIHAILAVALAAGMVAAPRGGGGRAPAEGRAESPEAAPAPRRKRGFLRGLVTSMVGKAAGQVDWMRVGRTLVERYVAKSASAIPPEENGRPTEDAPNPEPPI